MKIFELTALIFLLTTGLAVAQGLESGIYLISGSGMPFKLKGTNDTLYIDGDPVIAKADIELVEQVYADWMPKEINSIRVKLNNEGIEKFRVATKNNVNERFGIIVNNELVSAPMVRAEITNGEISITARLTNKDVKSIIKGLKN